MALMGDFPNSGYFKNFFNINSLLQFCFLDFILFTSGSQSVNDSCEMTLEVAVGSYI
jgi:hypothetical protein